MPEQPVSVTLDADNLLWLKGHTASGKRRSLSDTFDALVTAARTGAHGGGSGRSVAGTIDIAADDPSDGSWGRSSTSASCARCATRSTHSCAPRLATSNCRSSRATAR